MSQPAEMIMILDFGSQYTQLIARRIREMGVFTEIVDSGTSLEEVLSKNPSGVVLSGGPNSLSEGSLPFDQRLLESEVPLLGICYGMQLMNALSGGRVSSLEHGEYGRQSLVVSGNGDLFEGVGREQAVWMSHRDSVEEVASCYEVIAKSLDGLIGAIQHRDKKHYGLQFHPEVAHTEQGSRMLANFIDGCGCEKKWTLESYVDLMCEEIRFQVGKRLVVSLVSGGVDSTVSTLLCQRALGAEQVHAVYIDQGLMRLGETEEVKEMFAQQGLKNFSVVDAKEEFFSALKGITDPEEKRRVIGTQFIEVVNREMIRLGLDGGETLLCQGTLYTDLIESGKGCGKHAAVIKTHHNVNPPIVEEKRRQGLIVEPNKEIFKDEVREVGKLLGLPKEMLWRHPFPGPGLGIRVLGEVTASKVATLQHADQIYIDCIRKAGLYDQIWQAFAVLIPVKTVGVMGDQRTEGNVVALRAVTSSDGMTADFFDFPPSVLREISTRIVNEVEGVNRVTYDITSKPPGTIEWE